MKSFLNKYVAGVVLLTVVGMARIVSTYAVFNGAYDEPAHIACGMEWLQWGTAACELQHPPLARIAVALGPFLKGARLAPKNPGQSFYDEGNAVLYSGGVYWSNSSWARAGTLPFFVLLCIVTFLWARRWFSAAAGFLAVLLLTCTSPILGHAGLATNDAACAAGAALALYQFLRWLEEPSAWRSLVWGSATAFAILCKFSNIPFLGLCFAIGLIAMRFRGFRPRVAQIGLAVGTVLTLAWAVYRFTVIAPGAFYGHQHPVIDNILSSRPMLDRVWRFFLSTPLPLADFSMGLLDLAVHNYVGHDSYLLGQWSQSGWWYFFPIVLAVKSPIGLLVLAGCGFWFVFRHARNADWKQSWRQLLTALFPLAILCVCMLSRIDLGVRHILPIYPLLAILGGHAVAAMVHSSRYAAITAVLLTAWVVSDSVRAQPDYLAHFNEAAGAHPETILCESDLDWGQDLERLRKRLEQKGIRDFSIAYFGTMPLNRAGLPRYQYVSPTQPTHGYVAVSLHALNVDYRKNGSYAWLKAYAPVERIGKSIDLYYLAP